MHRIILKHMILKYSMGMILKSLKCLMLGVADLHTPQALAAAESAIAGNQPPIMVAGNSSSSETESDDSSDEESYDDGNDDKETSCPTEHEKSNTVNEDAVRKATGKSRSKKRTRIVELS
ncbi:hypothetical protein ERO13_A01G180500v2 [Gossypium hirsutum]|nr:hypothetical protein ES319_A01G191700v1 [Gossypium barbadense]KAG4215481.1 hypothetical protein ERO13_A01G180500v2 [Gossypium hirsutum]TYI44108.1 hypothetical protein ES332_A01G214200v1 [Gossypium tomentosum]